MEGKSPDAAEKQVLAQVSSDALWNHTRHIAAEERLSGSEGEARAVRYFEEVMGGLGLNVEIIHHDAYISLPGKAELSVLAPEPKSIPCITHSFSPNTGQRGVEGELAPMSGGAGPGAILYVEGLASPDSVRKGESAGAAGMVFINSGESPREFIITPVWGHPTPESASLLPAIPVVTVSRDGGEYLKRLSQQGPIRVRVKTETWTGWKKLPLAVAQLNGSEEPEKFIMVSGHIDSWYYGATDNATANACILELARVLARQRAQLKRSVRFIWWSGHSHGRYAGSTWYVDNHWEDVHRNCVVHINVDSLGSKGATDYSEIMVTSEMKELGESVIRDVTDQSTTGRRMHRAGDQSFWGAGIPAMYMLLSRVPLEGSGADLLAPGVGWWWHTAHDTLDKVDRDILLLDTRVYLATIWRLATEPVLPISLKPLAQELISHLDRLTAEAGGSFDLAPAVRAARKFQETADRFDRAAAELGSQSIEEGRLKPKFSMVNDAVIRASRYLMPVLYTMAGEFEHDLAVPVPPIPGLQPVRKLAGMPRDSAESRFLHTKLIRERNRLVHSLSAAEEYIGITLQHL